jgi:hypothetical protein
VAVLPLRRGLPYKAKILAIALAFSSMVRVLAVYASFDEV